MLVKWPGKVRPSTETDVAVAGTDLLPTFKAILGERQPDQGLDGESLLALWTSKPHNLQHRPLFWYEPVYLNSYDRARYERDQVMHLMELTPYGEVKQRREIESLPGNQYPAWRLVPAAAVRKGDYKLIRYLEYDSLELYNLKIDPFESANLAHTEPGKASVLDSILTHWAKSTGAELTLASNPDFDPQSIIMYEDRSEQGD